MTKIETGDKVILYRIDEDDNLYADKVTVLHLPCGEGDTIQVQTDEEVILINPYSRLFDSMVKEMIED